jgi:hypothetical protein
LYPFNPKIPNFYLTFDLQYPKFGISLDKSQVRSGIKMMELGQAGNRRCVRWGSGLDPGMPAGARQADCERTPGPLADARANDLWKECNESQQELLSVRFLQSHEDLLRDALLDVQADSPPPSAPSRRDQPREGGGAWLGEIVWEIWMGYRDRELKAMRRRGELPRS